MGYWIAAVGLVVFGVLGAMSIGQPFMLVGLAMLVLGPVRRRPNLFWPPMLAVVAYDLALWSISPFYCSLTSVPGVTPAPPSCSSVLGISWPWLADPAVAQMASMIALFVAVIVFVATAGILWWRGRAQDPAR